MLRIISPYTPTGDQPKAIDSLVSGIQKNLHHQVLLGVTGSGKTFTMASVIERTKKPALIISPNKTLAAQLYQEFRDFFPSASVHYFVSYYDYYQPEAYIPNTDTYIEKDAQINEELDRLRHEATQAVLERSDVIVIASVSCIYNIGSPKAYSEMSLELKKGKKISRKALFNHLVLLQYEKNDFELKPGIFRTKGEMVEIINAGGDKVIKIEMPSSTIERITLCETKRFLDNAPHAEEISSIKIFPAKYWVSPEETLPLAVENIRTELQQQLQFFKKEKKYIEEQRLRERTLSDLEMLEIRGYCRGVENYSRQLEFRKAGERPYTLLDYFSFAHQKNYLLFIDESHIGIPQLKAMSQGDRARKQTLIDFGFRLPSAGDNRPLTFEEFSSITPKTIYVSATPGTHERGVTQNTAEQMIRPTGLLDPSCEVRPTKNQIKDLVREIKQRTKKGERALVTTITKRLAEHISEFLIDEGIKATFMHSEIKTLERPDILKKLREGAYDVLVGVNLLREGLDLPEVSLVAILDADKEGFLRNETTLIQTMGRAARHIQGHVIMYADKITDSMANTMREIERRRKIQKTYNEKNKIIPSPITSPIKAGILPQKQSEKITYQEKEVPLSLLLTIENPKKLIKELENEMKRSAKELEFEKAASLRDRITEIKKKIK
jgi:excinuclease ABC subunit B